MTESLPFSSDLIDFLRSVQPYQEEYLKQAWQQIAPSGLPQPVRINLPESKIAITAVEAEAMRKLMAEYQEEIRRAFAPQKADITFDEVAYFRS